METIAAPPILRRQLPGFGTPNGAQWNSALTVG